MDNLENQLLIAMPALDDSYFKNTVTYVCEHNDEGAMGLIINLPVNLTIGELLTQINDDTIKTNTLTNKVLSGGPVAQDRGFVLHSPQNCWSSSLALSDDVMITTSKDILLSLGTKHAPTQYLVTLGYAGWGPGQLEEELKENAWLTAPADTEILFHTPSELRWQRATEKLGFDISHLSSDIGHA